MSSMTDRIRPQSEVPELAEIRARLAGARGPRFWRSLEELAETETFQQFLHREFPENASEWQDPIGRRRFLQLMGASLALAGVSGCVVQPEEQIVPYVRAPEDVVPGKPLYFASAAVHEGFGSGILVESHMGRPTKIEGNPDHPESQGATDLFAQASILTVYDPDRSQVITRNGRVSTWSLFLDALIDLRASLLARRGAGLRVISGTTTSPTLARLMRRLFAGEVFPEARWYIHDPVGSVNERASARLAFGEDVTTVHHIEKARTILAVECDFLAWGPSKLRDARALAARREAAAKGGAEPNRLYVVESCPTITGAAADHRWPLPASQATALLRHIARAVGVPNIPAPEHGGEVPSLAAIVDDLKSISGQSLVLVGETQPPEAHALAHAINAALGAVGATITYHDAFAAYPPQGRGGTPSALADEIRSGAVDTLLILEVNPAYDGSVDLEFADLMLQVPTRIHLGLYADETAERATWHIPQAHYLESWGDVRTFDGTATILQPTIAPLYGGKTAIEVVSALIEGSHRTAREIVRETWSAATGGGASNETWSKALHDGVVAGTAAAPKSPQLQGLGGLRWAEDVASPEGGAGGALELQFRPDATVWDGSHANNGWLQELPKSLTKLTWDNAALISPATARARRIETGDVLELGYRGRRLRAAALVQPGHADGSVTLALGYGRTSAGRVGTGQGFNAYRLRTSDAPWWGTGLTVEKTGETYPLATTQMHHDMAGRNLVRVATLDEFHANPWFAQDVHHWPGQQTGDAHAGAAHHGVPRGGLAGSPDPRLTLYEHPEPMQRRNDGEGNRWGLSINLNACIGCAACVIACQAENNIPVVGKDQVSRGREMHWLRIDRYYATADEAAPERNPRILFQPVTCMHCENAPCELVCPVGATTHSAEGLNEMTYNRCVGTRYCSNNCPYKVRRFNFFQYNDEKTPTLKLLRNPDVTVRTRGVMEKCTYCVQRINAARIASELAGEERVGGNAVVTACQQACPTRAIVFGNLNDAAAEVVEAKNDPRTYVLLSELNTRPRTSYLARLTNPNPAIES
jgi:molybdopterin-containing oxidoreductase family iron-sulfur binding subunit